jgi:chromosome segregation ATPase
MEDEKTLEEFLEEAPLADEQRRVSRRQFLTGAVVGGAAGLTVAGGTGVAVWKVYESELLAAKEAAEAELAAIKAAADAEMQAAQNAADNELLATMEAAAEELAKTLGLLELYEELDEIGLDGILEKGLAAVALPLEAVEVGAKALSAGLEWAEKALRSLAEALPTAQESLLWLEAQVTAVAEGLEKLQTSVARALNKAVDNAVGRAVEDFINKILDNLPFGLGDKFREALEGLVALVASVDELVSGINTLLLEPLREKWFSDEEGKGVGGTFVDPLIENVLDPLEAHLVNLALLTDSWQAKLMNPSQEALAVRANIREEIARYKEEYGFS